VELIFNPSRALRYTETSKSGIGSTVQAGKKRP
jgi:hypothetical protein